MKSLPIYAIKDFKKFSEEDAFYANYLRQHIQNHDFTNTPHKHDFFFLVLFTSGSGTHEIDFKKYPIKPGSLFVLRPGQMHNWKVSAETDGYIFFHTRDFYDEGFTKERVQDYPFYSSRHISPLVQLKKTSFLKLKELLREITEEYYLDKSRKYQKLHSLVTLVYIELSRAYTPVIEPGKENYLDKLKKFEELIDRNFKDLKNPRDYASLLNISEKHLNRISQTCLKKTSTDLISERIILEAKRMLIHSRLSVTQIADALGYKDNSYFNRFFKKRTGTTPSSFMKKYTSS